MDVIETVEWQKPTERETVRVRFAIEHKKDVENQRSERMAAHYQNRITERSAACPTK